MNHWNGLPRLVRERAPKIIRRALNVLIIGAPTPKVPGPAPLPERNDAAINAYFESQPDIDHEEDLNLIPNIPTAVDAEYYDSAEGENYDDEEDGEDNGRQGSDDGGDCLNDDARVEGDEENHEDDEEAPGGARARTRPSMGDE
jgi:hypothetical protein